ncbi:hypothetical protein ACFWN1_04740 [Streptomyces sp. NPDC058459]|uniref:hypothetical protein n=1 Tax=Streptomyces sp. NPDC058459 TaxID=3346508 RepID=UPI0036591124
MQPLGADEPAAAGPYRPPGRLRRTDRPGGSRVDILTLRQATASRLPATSTGAEDNHQGCDPAPRQVESAPTGDGLSRTSTSAAEGNPGARLSEVTPDD